MVSRWKQLLVAVMIAVAFFALGMAVTRRGPEQPPVGPREADSPPPRVFIDQGSVSLLPDAALHVEWPAPPLDASSAGR